MEIALDLKKRYTYAEYLSDLFKDIRCELINGFVKLFPSPVDVHARITSRLNGKLINIIEKTKGNCEVFHAPFDVILYDNQGEVEAVLQPDVFVVCDLSKIRDWCHGAPDLVIEVLSPSTSSRDWKVKYNLYEKHGVREYWIVDPYSKSINVFILEENKYTDGVVYEKGKIPIFIFGGYEIEVESLFKNI